VAEEEGPAVDPILLQKVLTESSLPSAYTFEVTKSVQRILKLQATHVALQMPEGLLLYATVLADVFQRLASCLQQVSILGDVTYGACCVDDLGAQALGAELLIHYGHSCLVPLQHTVVPCLYVFVEIHVDVPHLVDCLDITLRPQSPKPRVYLLGTVQFRHAFVQATQLLKEKGYEEVSIPQAKPLSPGEVLGCTSPELVNDGVRSIVCFVADGRFHLEATLISNPHVDLFYRYDPYSKTLTEEAYDHDQMKSIRSSAIATSRGAQVYGIVLGTLGRQGNPAIVHRIRESLRAHGKRHFLMLLSEITPAKLQLFDGKIDAWVQVACPRLSVDWGHFLSKKPVLSPYELFVSLEETDWRDNYPMDYYAHAGGPWTNYFEENKQRQLP
jgi:2-(3-amino-3-carboxypropyl)histidine synthase